MIELKLETPIHFGSEVITKLSFSPLKAKHMRALPKDIGMNDLLNLASTLSGVPSQFLDELSSSDTIRVMETINRFFQTSQRAMEKC